MEEPLAPSTAVTLKRRTMSHLPLVRFTGIAMLLVAVDSLVCIALWLAGGDSLYLEDSIKEFSFTHSTFDLVIIAALRGLILFGCFYFLEHNSILSVSVKHDDSRKSLTQRFAMLCQAVILLCSGVSLIYAVVKGGMIIHSIIKGTWTDVSKETEMHITYKILCIIAVVFPLMEFGLGLVGLWFVRRMIRVQKLRLLVNLEEGDENKAAPPKKKANIKRIILTAKPVSHSCEPEVLINYYLGI